MSVHIEMMSVHIRVDVRQQVKNREHMPGRDWNC